MATKHLGKAKPNSPFFTRDYTINTVPWTKPDPALVKIVLRNLRDQLKAQHEKKQSGVRSSPKVRD